MTRPIKTIFYSSHFGKAFKKLPAILQSQAAKQETVFRRNCFDPKLKTHKLKGKKQNLWSFSVTYSHRIVFRFLFDDTVIFIDIGDHSIY